ncbi:Alpha/beta-Hydrolases superfamily protein [Theobroma cacao]|uniref:soluble epoxide hydrolase n=1 Tax=Theobroma cacao TaxID=3641 RepID=A0A061EQE1_THECC|nr:Alpha/beta-Hydrolases superfamily protein [Theobroma cacao]
MRTIRAIAGARSLYPRAVLLNTKSYFSAARSASVSIPGVNATVVKRTYFPFYFSLGSRSYTSRPGYPREGNVEMEEIEHRIVNVNGINMHVAEKGKGPVILFLHGFPELWYSWRHQITAFASLGYQAVAPDLCGYGDTDAPDAASSYTVLNVVGDLVALLDVVAPEQDKVFVVGHDWGALIAWWLCLVRPDRVKALVNMSVVFSPRNPKRKPLESLRAFYGDDYYICRFQAPGEIEAEFAELGFERVLKGFLTYRNPGPLLLPKGKYFGQPDTPISLPPNWLSEEDVKYYISQYEKKGFTGGLNYYRNIDLNWELTAPWTGSQVKVPVKFIVGDQDLTYNAPGTKDYIQKGGLKRDVPFLEQVVVMEGVAHFLHEEKPDEINKHMTSSRSSNLLTI